MVKSEGMRPPPLSASTILPIPGNPGNILPGLHQILRHCVAVPILWGDCLGRQTRRGPYLLSGFVRSLFGFARVVRDRAKLGDIFGALLM